jgi:CheY-like chemotaxis protein
VFARKKMIAGRGRTALVVDDERLIRLVMIDALEQCEYAVLEAEDGPSALKILQSSEPIDLLIADHHLPGGMTGRELAESACKTRPSLRVLLISGLPEAVVAGNRGLPDKVRLLAKPFSMVKLVTAVAALHHRVSPAASSSTDE